MHAIIRCLLVKYLLLFCMCGMCLLSYVLFRAKQENLCFLCHAKVKIRPTLLNTNTLNVEKRWKLESNLGKHIGKTGFHRQRDNVHRYMRNFDGLNKFHRINEALNAQSNSMTNFYSYSSFLFGNELSNRCFWWLSFYLKLNMNHSHWCSNIWVI